MTSLITKFVMVLQSKSLIGSNTRIKGSVSWLGLVAVLYFLSACSALLAESTPVAKTTGKVFILDGSKQCQNLKRDIAIDIKTLEDANINIVTAECGVITGTYYPSVCGAANGKVHLFMVDDVERANELGFSRLESLPQGQDILVKKCQKLGDLPSISLN